MQKTFTRFLTLIGLGVLASPFLAEAQQTITLQPQSQYQWREAFHPLMPSPKGPIYRPQNVNVPQLQARLEPYDYYQIPLAHVLGYDVSARVNNGGTNALTNVRVRANSISAGFNFSRIDSIPSIAAGGNATTTFGGANFVPTSIGEYFIKMELPERPTDPWDPTAVVTDTIGFSVNDSTYARDNGLVDGALGFPTGTAGSVGVLYTLNTEDTLTSISFLITGAGPGFIEVGDQLTAAVFRVNTNGSIQTAPLRTSLPVTITAATPTFYTAVIQGGGVILPAGEYLFAVNQSTPKFFNLATCPFNYRSNSVFISFGGSPWISLDFQPPAAQKNVIVRPNFGRANIQAFAMETDSFTVSTPYQQIPLPQNDSVYFSARVKNVGARTLNNINFNVSYQNSRILNSSIDSLQDGRNRVLETRNYLATGLGLKSFRLNTTAIEPIADTTNNEALIRFALTDSVYAYDNGTVLASLRNPIPDGAGGFLTNITFGNKFTVFEADTLTSIAAYLDSGRINTQVNASVWRFVGNLPNQVVATAVPVTITNRGGRWYNLLLDRTTPLILTPGQYLIAFSEPGGATGQIGMGINTNNFRSGASFTNARVGNQQIGWRLNEDFWSGRFNYAIRANFGRYRVVNSLAAGLNNVVSVFPNPTESGELRVRFSQEVVGGLSLKLHTLTGQTVVNTQSEAFGNTADVVVPVANLAKGVYLLEITTPQGRAVKQVVIQ